MDQKIIDRLTITEQHIEAIFSNRVSQFDRSLENAVMTAGALKNEIFYAKNDLEKFESDNTVELSLVLEMLVSYNRRLTAYQSTLKEVSWDVYLSHLLDDIIIELSKSLTYLIRNKTLRTITVNSRIIHPDISTSSSGENNSRAQVYIALPEEELSHSTIEAIQNACGALMEALGYEYEAEEEPVWGSFFHEMWFKLSSSKAGKEVADGYAITKMALESKYVYQVHAESSAQLSTAAAALIASLGNVNEAAIRTGILLVVKVTEPDGTPKIIVETLSPEMSKMLDERPQILNKPRDIFKLYEEKPKGELGSGEEVVV